MYQYGIFDHGHSAGLTMAIANPAQELMTAAAFASDLLTDKKEGTLRYIAWAERKKKAEESIKAGEETYGDGNGQKRQVSHGAPGGQRSQNASIAGVPSEPGSEQAVLQRLKQAVLKGNRNEIEELTRRALDAGADPQHILQEWLLPAINEVGDLFDSGQYFLPQLIAGAEAMKRSIGILEPLLQKEGVAQDAPAWCWPLWKGIFMT